MACTCGARGRDVLALGNLAEFGAELDGWVDACEELAEGALRGICSEAFELIVRGTPEWTGNLAASWKLTVGAPAAWYDPTIFKSTGWDRLSAPGDHTPSPFSRQTPNEAAIHYALSIAREQITFVRLGADVFITNNAPYSVEVETNLRAADGRAFLRPVNLVDGRVEMLNAAADKFGDMGEISETRALALAEKKL